jgi:glutamate/tyrosine decarboxylase-like PLP-dependent enzyme
MEKKEMEHLAWFLGPKAENAPFLEELLLLIFRDYLHWRKNYFPGDKILINKSMQREFEDDHDRFSQNVHEMMAELRRNFPFYSPRYIAHMLADTALPSVLGYIAGMLYNPNNVTPEAAPVTVDWEIEAANEILKMIGYVTPPPPPPPLSEESAIDYYGKMAKAQFGWAHITMGGTTANVEALWIARAVKYFPLSVRDIAIEHDLDLTVKLADGTQKRIGEFSESEVLSLKPNESIYLLGRYVDAVRRKHEMSASGASDPAWELLKASPYSLSKGTGSIFSRHPPVIFVSGAAHYSILKAADVLGIGKDNVVLVKMDSMFRMDVADLEEKIMAAVRESRVPLAVVAIVGTTEEGAVDPVHEILDLRDRLQQQHNISFWLHVDSAWGGYIRSLFTFEQADIDQKLLSRMARRFGFRHEQDPSQWHRVLTQLVEERIREEETQEKTKGKDSVKKDEKTRKRIEGRLSELKNVLRTGNSELYLKTLKKLVLERTFIFSEVSSAPLTADSITDWPAFLAWLKSPSDDKAGGAAKTAIKKCLSRREQKYVDGYAAGQPVNAAVTERILECLNKLLSSAGFSNEKHFSEVVIPEEAQRLLKQGVENLQTKDLRRLNKLLFLTIYQDNGLRRATIKETDFRLGLQGRVELINDFVQDEVEMEFDSYHNRIRLVWGTKEVCSAFMAIPKANSVTIDPHKLGYLTYPCGIVAFQNDRVRHFVMQRAPYITSSKHNALIHVPPKHADVTGQGSGKTNVFIDSFGPFILEGSRPGAAAASLWLTTKTIPLTMRKHGGILRSSLLAARELYEWLNRWDLIMQTNGVDTDYEFLPLTSDRPDTNIVIFVCKKKTSTRIGAINKLTKGVYERFAIQTELGERKYSYAQPFFLSKTSLEEPEYQYGALENFFTTAKLSSAKKDYQKEGLVVLRATVMSPYLYPMKHFTGQNFSKEFLEELATAARESVKDV